MSELISTTLLPALLFIIMLGMGMSLSVMDFKRVVLMPGAVFLGLGNQILLLPLVGFVIAYFLELPPIQAMGLMILAACPGGATSNLTTHLCKGDTALSITLTALSSIITVFSIPYILNFSLDYFISAQTGTDIRLPIDKTIWNIVKLTALPVAIGMWIKKLAPSLSKRLQTPVNIGSGVAILVALGLMLSLLAERGSIWQFVQQAGWAAILLNISTMSLGFVSAKLFRLSTARQLSISIESGMQNGVLGMTLAISPAFFGNPEMAVTSGVYGIVMVSTGFLLIYVSRRYELALESDNAK